MPYKCAPVKNRKGKVVRKQCYHMVNGRPRFVKNSTKGCSCSR
jgi:hypothetical protein